MNMATMPAQRVAAEDPLRSALIDSRHRWRDLVAVAADLAFETDSEGRFSFIWPDTALGWPAASLLGEPATTLLHATEDAAFDPFRPAVPVRGRRTWLRRADGRPVCLAFFAAPLLDAAGRVVGARGIGQDVTEQDSGDAMTAARLRRGEVLDHILGRMRQEVMAPRMMQATLEALRQAVAADGVAVLDVVGSASEPKVLHHAGDLVECVIAAAPALLDQRVAFSTELATGISACDRELLVCLCQTRFGEQVALVLWRDPGGRPWDGDDTTLVSSTTGIVRVILEHEAIQREMALQARTDPLTGLLNRRAFLDELNRRLDRLDREGLPGTLMFVDLDRFKQLNDRCGHDRGDEALCSVAALLRDTVRPTDLVARLGGDEFALWLDGADELSAAERAEGLRVATPTRLAALSAGSGEPLGMSIGIATRWPGRSEDIEALIHRADSAMYEVKRSGRGHWKVSHAESW